MIPTERVTQNDTGRGGEKEREGEVGNKRLKKKTVQAWKEDG